MSAASCAQTLFGITLALPLIRVSQTPAFRSVCSSAYSSRRTHDKGRFSVEERPQFTGIASSTVHGSPAAAAQGRERRAQDEGGKLLDLTGPHHSVRQPSSSTSGMAACSICSMGAMASRWVPRRAASLSIHCGPCAARWQLPPLAWAGSTASQGSCSSGPQLC